MILLVGATGSLGGRVAARLVETGLPVRVLVRPKADAAAIHALGAEVANGDLSDYAGLAQACAGVDTVVSTATAMGRRLGGDRKASIRHVDETGVVDLVRAAEQAGVRRFVCVSYAGVDAELGFALERAKLAIEQRLRRSSMRTVIVRPDAFQDVHLTPIGRFDIARGRVEILGTGNTKHRWVSVDDVAALLAAVAIELDPPQVIEFGGPESLSRNETITMAERASGRTMTRRRMPRPLVRAGMRLLARLNPALSSVFGLGLVIDLVEPDWDDAPLLNRGIDPKPASEFIQEQAY